MNDAAFSPDGRWIATAAQDGIARIWDANQGDLVAQFPTDSSSLSSVAFSPDGGRLLAASWNGTARIWLLTREVRPVEDLRSLASLLAGRQLNPSGTLARLGTAAVTNAWHALKAKYPEDFRP